MTVTQSHRSSIQAVHDLIASRESDSLEAVREWLRRPSFSDNGEGMTEGAAYALELLKQVSEDAAIVPTSGYPMVFGTTPSTNPDAPWLLIYGLYDVTPLVEDEWTVPPLEARIMEAKDLGILGHLGQVLVGRGANNHKGPVLASILAVRAMLGVRC